jgi:undecaprenyl pyrophosphate phosphatase UppP
LFSSFATNPLSIILKPADGQLVYFLVFISILVVFFTAAIAQIYTITTSFIRISKIEAFYNSFIVAPDEITALKKSTNRRDMIIFCLVTVIVGLIVYAIYKRVSQSKKQTVIVKG